MRIILNKTPLGYWYMEVEGMPQGIPVCLQANAKAGDVAAYVVKCNPRAKVGIRSAVIGPEVVAAYGETLWLRDGFSRDPGDVHGEQ